MQAGQAYTEWHNQGVKRLPNVFLTWFLIPLTEAKNVHVMIITGNYLLKR